MSGSGVVFEFRLRRDVPPLRDLLGMLLLRLAVRLLDAEWRLTADGVSRAWAKAGEWPAGTSFRSDG